MNQSDMLEAISFMRAISIIMIFLIKAIIDLKITAQKKN